MLITNGPWMATGCFVMGERKQDGDGNPCGLRVVHCGHQGHIYGACSCDPVSPAATEGRKINGNTFSLGVHSSCGCVHLEGHTLPCSPVEDSHPTGPGKSLVDPWPSILGLMPAILWWALGNKVSLVFFNPTFLASAIEELPFDLGVTIVTASSLPIVDLLSCIIVIFHLHCTFLLHYDDLCNFHVPKRGNLRVSTRRCSLLLRRDSQELKQWPPIPPIRVTPPTVLIGMPTLA